jgi:hypothetical protein
MITSVLAVVLVPVTYLLGRPRSNGRPAASPFFARLRERLPPPKASAILDGAVPVVMLIAFWYITKLQFEPWALEAFETAAEKIGLSIKTVRLVTIYAVPIMVCFFFVDRPVRFGLCVAAVLGLGTYRNVDRDVIHVDRSFFGVLKIEKDWDPVGVRMTLSEGDKKYRVWSGKVDTLRLVHGTTLHGTQITKLENSVWDAFQYFPVADPWTQVAVGGALASFDPRQEPLTYYHRTGPVGAMFYELRTRKGGADRTADVAMIGLGTGSVSGYALPGQRLDFYEIDHHVKKLVADRTDFFTYTSDAQKRGATLEFYMGDARLKLKEQAGKKYALLLVDAFSSDAIPVHLLTKEAVQLYFDRMTEDGILALHISNKYVKLEPVVARIAAELGLASRVWSDDSEGYTGKTASSWVVLARDDATLGVLGADQPKQVAAFGVKNPELVKLLAKYGPEKPAKEALTEEYGADVTTFWENYQRVYDEFKKADQEGGRQGLNVSADVKKGNLKKEMGEIQKTFLRRRGEAALDLVYKMRQRDVPTTFTLRTLSEMAVGPMFHKLNLIDGVKLWTDDFADVAQVLTIPELQSIRRFFGQSSPLETKE